MSASAMQGGHNQREWGKFASILGVRRLKSFQLQGTSPTDP